MNICPRPSLFTLSHGVQGRARTYQQIYQLLFQNQMFLLTLTILSSFINLLPPSSPISFLNHFIPQPKQAKITLVSFSHGIALFSSSTFSINGGSGPLDTFLFVVFLFFLSCAGHIFVVNNNQCYCYCCSCCSGLKNYFLCPL